MNSNQSEKEKQKQTQKIPFCLDQVERLEKCIQSWENFSQPNYYCSMDITSLKFCSEIDKWIQATVRQTMQKK